MNSLKKRDRPAKKIGGGSLPLATASSPMAAASSATPSNGGHPRNAPGKWETTTVGRNTQELTSLSQIGIFAPHWVEKSLLDVCVLVTDGTHDSPKPVKIGFPLVTGKAIKNREIDFSVTYNISESDHLKVIARSKPEIDDILFANIGNSIGDLVRVKSSHDFSIKNVALFKPNKFVINPRFLEYYLLSDQVQVFIKNTLKGSAQPFIGLASLRGLSVAIPPMLEQNVIASVLGSLDDKIALNRRINQTLEAMAQALFQSWFVDFDPVKAKQKILEAGGTARDAEFAAMQIISGKNPHQLKIFQQTQPQQYAELEHTAKLFPNRLVESELGLVPEGWKVKALDEIANYQNGLPLQKFRPEKDSEFLPVVKIAQLQTGIADTEERASVNIRPECIIDNGDVVFSWSGSLLVDIWCGGKAALNQHLFKVTSDVYPKWFYFYFTKIHLEEFQRIASAKAVTMGHIKREHLSQALCAVPSNQVIDNLTPRIESLLKKQIDQRLETKSLEVARDSLLPKLLSGEIDVSSINGGTNS